METLGLQSEELSLHNEILLLETKLQCPLSLQLQEFVKSSMAKLDEKSCKSCTYQEIVLLQNELNVLKRLTDVTVKEVFKSQQSNADVQRIMGEVCKVPFELNFTTLETKQDLVDVSTVQNLRIKVDKTLPKHAKDFVSKCEKKCCIKDFFHGIVPYFQWCKLKEKTFSHFKSKYQGFVTVADIEGDTVLQFNAKSELYTLTWDNLIRDKFTAEPVLDLYITTPVTGGDTTHQQLSQKFQSLLEKHGIEAAIDTLFSSL